MNDSQTNRVTCPHCPRDFTARGLPLHIRASHPGPTGIPSQPFAQSQETAHVSPIDEFFVAGFGKKLLCSSENDDTSEWYLRWKKIIKMQGKQYELPQGPVGRQFVGLLTETVQSVVDGSRSSEGIFVLCATVLQRERQIKIGPDIRRLLLKRMDLWRKGCYDELIQEAIRCDRQLKNNKVDNNENEKARVFRRLVEKGKLREATRWATDRSGGSVLHPDTMVGGQTVVEVLRSKHPPQMEPNRELFDAAGELPLLVDVNIAASHIERAAHRLRGSAGPSGTDAQQWRDMLL
ncbi:hypothetical protein GE061_018366 [Apolygus lucorum]|uniref:Uncharacterized protein n=1 Tax=Apolygus lucorum TaxID=248454 RepID=A0A8S9XDR1_APOLU|nr:hypothetical protein GE061_018366 [Apolygus lucorum]